MGNLIALERIAADAQAIIQRYELNPTTIGMNFNLSEEEFDRIEVNPSSRIQSDVIRATGKFSETEWYVQVSRMWTPPKFDEL